MFLHVILGLLRDGSQRHGYDLVTLYRARSGTNVSPGNFYRELARTRQIGWVETAVNPPNADARRIPYCITDRGRRAFDEWLLAPLQEDHTLSDWILFVDRVPVEARERVVGRHRQALWVRSKALARAREDALAAPRRGWDPLPPLLIRQLKQVSAELEFLAEFREMMADWDRQADRRAASEGVTPIVDAPAVEAPVRVRRKTTAR